MQTTANAVPLDERLTIIDPMAGKTRADRRRLSKDLARRADYAESGFVDRAVYAPALPRPTHAGKDRLTPQQLHERAVERQVMLIHRFKAASEVLSPHELARLFDDRAPHANRSTAERKHYLRTAQRERCRAAYWRGVAFNEMGKTANGKRSLAVYAHSSARQEAPVLAMAA